MTEPLMPAADPAPKPAPILERAWVRYSKLEECLRQPPERLDPDYVHDLRVLTRRVTEVLRLMKPLLEPAIALGIGAALGDLRRAAAEFRDLDVLAEHLERWRLPRPLRQVAQEISAGLPARRSELEQRLRQAISSTSTQGLLMLLGRSLDPVVQTGGAGAVEARMVGELRKLMRRRQKKMEKLFGQAAKKQTDVSLHEARIGVKKLRYVAEIAETAGLRGAGKAVRTFKGLQELLGKHHDVSVITGVLAERIKQVQQPNVAKRRALRNAWGKWQRRMQREQAGRAAQFFLRTYLWRNGTVRATMLHT